MKKDLKVLIDRIKTNITNENGTYLNNREIDIPKGNLIVLGFIERVSKGGTINNGYVMMGVYEDGSINGTVYFKNGMVLFTTDTDESIGDKISVDESFMETHNWWRIPTDDEIILYENVYKSSLLDKVNYILDNLDDMGKEEIWDYLLSLKYKIESESMEI